MERKKKRHERMISMKTGRNNGIKKKKMMKERLKLRREKGERIK